MCAIANLPAAANQPTSSRPRSPVKWPASFGPSPGACRRRRADRQKPVIASKGGASEPPDTLLLGKAEGAVAVRRTLATTICRVDDPTQVPRSRQLRDASTVMRFRPAHQSMINRRHDGRASCLAWQSLKRPLPMQPQIHLPATWKGGNESGRLSSFRIRLVPFSHPVSGLNAESQHSCHLAISIRRPPSTPQG